MTAQSKCEPAQVWVEIWGIWKPAFGVSFWTPGREYCEALAESWNESKPWGPGTRYEVRCAADREAATP